MTGSRRAFAPFLAAFMLLVLLLPTSLLAQRTCDDLLGMVCVEAEAADTSVSLYGVNLHRLMPVTLNLNLTLDNLRLESGGEGPVVLQGGSRIALARLRSIRTGKWSYRYEFEWSRGDFTARHDPGTVYRLPFANGDGFTVSQGCDGASTHVGPARNAVDFSMKTGTSVHAARAGRVVLVKEDSSRGGADAAYRNDGNNVVVQHDDSTLGQYFHLQPNGVHVRLGDWIAAGDLLGYSGNTGQSTGPHLHFDVIRGAVGRESETLPVVFETASGRIGCPRVGATVRIGH